MSLNSSFSRHFNRAAVSYDTAAFLHREVGNRLLERLEFIKLNPHWILDLGCNTGFFTQSLRKRYAGAECIGLDIAFNMLKIAKEKLLAHETLHTHFLNADALQLPCADHSLDFIFSALVLQWCPDLPVVFREIHRVLKPGGLFLFATYGPDTLQELRQSWAAVDDFMHVNAFYDMHDMGDMLLQAQFSDPVVDMEKITFAYSDLMTFMRELKAVGANVVLENRRPGLMGKNRFQKMLNHYEEFRLANGKLPVTYEIVYGTAWGSELTADQIVDETGAVQVPLRHILGLHKRS